MAAAAVLPAAPGCSKKSHATLTKRTTSASAASAAPGAPAPRQSAARASPSVQNFLSWATANHVTPQKAAKEVECYGPDDSDAGWCMGSVWAGSAHRYVKWRKSDPSAASFESEAFPAGLELSCASLKARQIRKWRWEGADAVLFHCQLTSGAFSGWHAWVKIAPAGTYVRVFSADYLKYDTTFAKALATQGDTAP